MILKKQNNLINYYSIENKNIEILMMDKEYFNTCNTKNKDLEFYYHNNRIYQYILILVVIILSFKVFYIYVPKKSIFKFYAFLFFCILIIQVINSYLIFLFSML